MFKQILIIISITILIIFIVYYILKNINISTHKLYLHENIVKYKMHDSDRDYLNKYSTLNLNLNVSNFKVFYTNTAWKPLSGDYIKFKERYYMIEPDYYYKVEGAELFINEDTKIHVLNLI